MSSSGLLASSNKVTIPLDGKTKLETEQLNRLAKILQNEIKTATDKAYQQQWQEHREQVIKIVANLLATDQLSSNNYVDQIKQKLAAKPTKKGRPKKKTNPWQYIIEKTHDQPI